MEHFDFEVSGKVTDFDGNPVKGISVSAYGSSASTLSDGTYLLKGNGGKNTSISVSFTDVDGDKNGGLFTGASKMVDLEYVKGSHGPYLGLFRKSGVDVVLTVGIIEMPDTDIPLQ